MADLEENSLAGNGQIRLEDEGSQEVAEEPTRSSAKEWTARMLQSKAFHRTILTLILIDFVIVVIEISWKLLDNSCPKGGEETAPAWIQVLLYISMAIASLFVLELPPTIWVFGFDYYNPWSGVQHSTFHLLDAIIIILNFVFMFLQGPAQEIGELLILLRIWRLVKLLGGVATGVENLNHDLQLKLDNCERELASKKRELEETSQQLVALQRKIDATQA
ncbi:hypothetical protein FRC18_008773 [Serendipita sp. 400]|nr:hypothetical protein FRC18_008773 [Serendipita sp. 400]